jgi:hypothetical protein
VSFGRRWLVALVIALVLAGSRLFVDVLAPPHLRWWFTAAVAFAASMWTSAYWITRRVYRPAAQPLTEEENNRDHA